MQGVSGIRGGVWGDVRVQGDLCGKPLDEAVCC